MFEIVALIKMAARNIQRNWRRTLLCALSIMVSIVVVVFMRSFADGLVNMIFENFTKLQTGHARIINKEYGKKEALLPLNLNIKNYKEIEEELKQMPEIILAAERTKFGVLLDYKGKQKAVLGYGIDPEKETYLLGINKTIIQGNYLRFGQPGMILGIQLAKELGIKLGDELTIITQTEYGSLGALNFKVAGIYQSGIGTIDKDMFFIPIDQAENLLDMQDKCTEILIMVKDPWNNSNIVESIKKSLNHTGLTVLPWQSQGILYMYVTMVKNMYMIIYAFLVLLASFTIFNTMYMAIFERTREIGMMMALGMKKSQVLAIILIEALIISIIGSLVGVIVGGGLVALTARTGISIEGAAQGISLPFASVIYPSFSIGTLIFGFFLGVIIGTAICIFPALRAARMQPTEALRTI